MTRAMRRKPWRNIERAKTGAGKPSSARRAGARRRLRAVQAWMPRAGVDEPGKQPVPAYRSSASFAPSPSRIVPITASIGLRSFA